MDAIISIKYYLKDNTIGDATITVDFSDDTKRGEFIVHALKLSKGGYIALIETSKLITETTDSKLIINPIHINMVEITGSFDGNHNLSLDKIMQISSDCDMRRYPNIDWVKIKNDRGY